MNDVAGTGDLAAEARKLDRALLEAHRAGDTYILAELYDQASKLKQMLGDDEAAAFLCTQAYVFALESGHATATDLHRRLVAMGRDTD